MNAPLRTLPWDWHPGIVPANVAIDDTAYLESTYSFWLYRSEAAVGTRIGRGASVYLGTMFDVGPRGQVSVGEYTLIHGCRIICDAKVEIGEYSLISWNVVLMDTYRVALDPAMRRNEVAQLAGWHAFAEPRMHGSPARPVRIGRNVWIGFDACVLPGVTIGEGSVVGARSVVAESVPPYTVVAGNPARVIRRLPEEAERHGP